MPIIYFFLKDHNIHQKLVLINGGIRMLTIVRVIIIIDSIYNNIVSNTSIMRIVQKLIILKTTTYVTKMH